MSYNITLLQNQTGFLAMPQAIYTNVGAWFGGILLFFVFLFLLTRMIRNGVQDAFLAASFLVSLAAGFLYASGVLPVTILVLPVTMLVLALIMKVWGEG